MCRIYRDCLIMPITDGYIIHFPIRRCIKIVVEIESARMGLELMPGWPFVIFCHWKFQFYVPTGRCSSRSVATAAVLHKTYTNEKTYAANTEALVICACEEHIKSLREQVNRSHRREERKDLRKYMKSVGCARSSMTRRDVLNLK